MLRTVGVFVLSLLMIASLQAKTILVVGDSLSAGYGLEDKQGWVDLLAEKLKQEDSSYVVVNISTSGDTTQNGLAKVPKALNRYNPQIVIVELGANDGLRGLSLKQVRANLYQIVTLSQQKGAKVLLLATQLPPNYGAKYLNQFNQIYQDLAKEKKVALIAMFLQGIAGNASLMQQDGLHPKREAQAKILQNVWPTLQPLLQP